MVTNITKTLPKSSSERLAYFSSNHQTKTLPKFITLAPGNNLGNSAFQPLENRIVLYENRIELTDRNAFHMSNSVPERHPDDIQRFSRHSRLRLMRLCSSVRLNSYYNLYHATLTWHNDFPADGIKAKRLFHRFINSLKAFSMDFDYVYRIELQQRGAPHFHLLMFFKKPLINKNPVSIQTILFRAWAPIIKDFGLSASLHSVKVTACEDSKKFFVYVSKYAAKEDSAVDRKLRCRRWGCSKTIDLSPVFTQVLSDNYLKVFKRNLYSYLRKKNRIHGKLDDLFFLLRTISLFISMEDYATILEATLQDMATEDHKT